MRSEISPKYEKRHKPNDVVTLSLLSTESSIYTFLARADFHLPCLEIKRSQTLFLAASDAPPPPGSQTMWRECQTVLAEHLDMCNEGLPGCRIGNPQTGVHSVSLAQFNQARYHEDILFRRLHAG